MIQQVSPRTRRIIIGAVGVWAVVLIGLQFIPADATVSEQIPLNTALEDLKNTVTTMDSVIENPNTTTATVEDLQEEDCHITPVRPGTTATADITITALDLESAQAAFADVMGFAEEEYGADWSQSASVQRFTTDRFINVKLTLRPGSSADAGTANNSDNDSFSDSVSSGQTPVIITGTLDTGCRPE